MVGSEPDTGSGPTVNEQAVTVQSTKTLLRHRWRDLLALTTVDGGFPRASAPTPPRADFEPASLHAHSLQVLARPC